MKTIIILGINADIGTNLANFLLMMVIKLLELIEKKTKNIAKAEVFK